MKHFDKLRMSGTSGYALVYADLRNEVLAPWETKADGRQIHNGFGARYQKVAGGASYPRSSAIQSYGVLTRPVASQL